MRKSLRAALAVLLFGAGTASVQAQTPDGNPWGSPFGNIYIGASGLYVLGSDSEVSGRTQGTSVQGDVEYDHGFGGLVSLGYEYSPTLRTEVELGYRRTDTSGLNLTRPLEIDFSNVKGNATSLSLMGNAIYSGSIGRVRPYVGGGIGVARIELELDSQPVTINGSRVGLFEGSSDSDTVFAYQGVAGIGFAVSEAVEVRAGYRYFATTDVESEGVKGGYATHNLETGVLVRF